MIALDATLVNLALIHPNVTAIAKRYLYRRIRLVREAHWLNPDPLIKQFKELGGYPTVESFDLGCPSIVSDDSTTFREVKHVIKLAQECKAPSLTLSGDGYFFRHVSEQQFFGLTSLTIHHYGQIHWQYEHIVTIINCNAGHLKQLTIAAHGDGQLTGNLYKLQPLPALEAFTFVHIESNDDPIGPLAFLAKVVEATEKGANLKYLAVQTAALTVVQIAHLLGDLLVGVEHLRLDTTWDPKLPPQVSIFTPMASYLTTENAPNLRRLEVGVRHARELDLLPPNQLEELGILMYGGPDHIFCPHFRTAIWACIEHLRRVRIYDVWRFPGCVAAAREICEPRGIRVSPLPMKDFQVYDGRGIAKEDFIDGKYINHRLQEAYLLRKENPEPMYQEPVGLDRLLEDWRRAMYNGRDTLIRGF